MATLTPQEICARRLQTLLAMPKGQRWAKQFLDGTEPSYPHQRGDITLRQLKAHTQGKGTVGLLPDGHGGLCRFGAIDLDMPRDGETFLDLLELLQSLQAAATERGLQTFGTFSGRRGFHLVVPLAFPTPWSVVHRALRRVARDVGYEPAELFPTKGKCLKLPCGIHGSTGAWSVVLPNLSNTSLDDLEWLADDITQGLHKAEQGEAITPNWDAQQHLLETVMVCRPQNIEDAAGESTVPDLELLEDGANPQCITTLLDAGPRDEHTLNGENLNLARYCAQRGMDDEDAEAMATQLWEVTPEGFSKKDLGASLKNFRSSFSKAQEGESTYLFRCSDMAAGGPEQARKLVAYGRCKGEACPCWPWGPGRPETSRDRPVNITQLADRDQKAEFPTSIKPARVESDFDFEDDPGVMHGRRLWRAIQEVHADGQQLTLSLVLAAAERLPEDPHPTRPAHQVVLADVMAEEELLSSAMGPDADAVMKTAALLSPAGFNARSTKDWDSWAMAVAESPPAGPDTCGLHLERLADIALRVNAADLGAELASSTLGGTVGPADALASAGQGVALLQRAATPDLAPADDHLEMVVAELLNTKAPKIQVKHPGLRHVLGGGFRQGQLVAAGGPPGSGKTAFALEVADDAAAAGTPVLFLSIEMTRSQLMCNSLSRLSGIDGRELDKGLVPNSTTANKLGATLGQYREIAKRLYLVEGDNRHTPGRIAALIGQVRHQQGLPPDAPLLVVIDYLQLMSLGVEGEESLPEPTRVARLSTALKQLARSSQCTVLALSDVTKEAMRESESGGRIGSAVFKDSARVLHACDTALVIQSGTVPAKRGKPGQNGHKPQTGTPAQNLLELALSEPGLREERRQQLEQALRELPHPGDTYSRWTVIKNRGGQSGGEVWSIYRRHLSQYLPCLPGESDAKTLSSLGGGHVF